MCCSHDLQQNGQASYAVANSITGSAAGLVVWVMFDAAWGKVSFGGSMLGTYVPSIILLISLITNLALTCLLLLRLSCCVAPVAALVAVTPAAGFIEPGWYS